MIVALTFSFSGSQNFTWLCNKGLHKNNVKHVAYFDSLDEINSFVFNELKNNGAVIKVKPNIFNRKYAGGRDWFDAMTKIAAYREVVNQFNMSDDDWLIDMDDDTFLENDKLLKLLTPDKSLVGIEHESKYNTKIGLFGHMSGACICMKVEYLKKVLNYSEKDLEHIRHEHLAPFCMPHIWDVIVSYLMFTVGAKPFNITRLVDCNASAEEHFSNTRKGDFLHFNYQPKIFLGESCPNFRYDIPLILRKKGII